MSREAGFTPTLIFLIGGFIIWAAHFLIIYGYVGLLCARPEWARLQFMTIGAVPLGVIAATFAALLALAVLLIRSSRSGELPADQAIEPRFSRALAAGGTGLAAVAIVWEGVFSIMAVPACV